jgi:hypothetical protein
MAGSRVEVIRLPDKRTIVREVRVNSEGGRLPGISGLLFVYSARKQVNDPIFNGRVETIELYDTSSHVREMRVNREDGMLPAIRFVLKESACKRINDPIVEGMVPLRARELRKIETITPLEHPRPVQGSEHFDTTDPHDHPVNPLLPTSVDEIKSHKKPSSTLE